MTQSERSAIATKGAEASNKVQAKKKTFKTIFESILEKKVDMAKLSDLQNYITDTTDLTAEEAMGMAIVIKAIQGDLPAFSLIRDTIGQKPVDVVENNVNITMAGELKEYSK